MIRTEAHDSVGTLVLDRPEKLNALNDEMLSQFADAVRELVTQEAAVIVVRSSAKHFSAGADLAEWAEPSADQAEAMSRVGEEAFSALAAAPIPSIAVIEGVAAGGGLELALACDLRIASSEARLGLPEAGLGNLPAYGGIRRLVDVVGSTRARELLFTADLVDGERAAEIGLVNWVAPPAEVWDLADRVVSQIGNADRFSVALAKSLTGDTPIDGLLARVTSQTDESRRRKQAFLAQRAAHKQSKPNKQKETS